MATGNDKQSWIHRVWQSSNLQFVNALKVQWTRHNFYIIPKKLQHRFVKKKFIAHHIMENCLCLDSQWLLVKLFAIKQCIAVERDTFTWFVLLSPICHCWCHLHSASFSLAPLFTVQTGQHSHHLNYHLILVLPFTFRTYYDFFGDLFPSIHYAPFPITFESEFINVWKWIYKFIYLIKSTASLLVWLLS